VLFDAFAQPRLTRLAANDLEAALDDSSIWAPDYHKP
jgi:hypothetical protein